MPRQQRWPKREKVRCRRCKKEYLPSHASWARYCRAERNAPMYCSVDCAAIDQAKAKKRKRGQSYAHLHVQTSLTLNSPPAHYGVPEVWEEVGW